MKWITAFFSFVFTFTMTLIMVSEAQAENINQVRADEIIAILQSPQVAEVLLEGPGNLDSITRIPYTLDVVQMSQYQLHFSSFTGPVAMKCTVTAQINKADGTVVVKDRKCEEHEDKTKTILKGLQFQKNCTDISKCFTFGQ